MNKTFRDDYGIYPKKNGFYVQLTINEFYYCGGYSLDINKVRQFRDKLLIDVKKINWICLLFYRERKD